MGGNGSIIKSIDESSFMDVPYILVSDTVGQVKRLLLFSFTESYLGFH